MAPIVVDCAPHTNRSGMHAPLRSHELEHGVTVPITASEASAAPASSAGGHIAARSGAKGTKGGQRHQEQGAF
eukprot:scaffold1167_cov154-Isochrysis_galbana.AAC.6